MMIRYVHIGCMALLMGSVLFVVGCAAPSTAPSGSHGKQFTTMWEEIYGRLKPEIDSGNISLERGEVTLASPSVTNDQASTNSDGAGLSASAAAVGTPAPGAAAREFIRIRLTDRVLFDSGDDQIKADGVNVLSRLGRILAGEKGLEIVIQGYTDNASIRERLRSKFADNMALSQARAANAAQILRSNGVAHESLRLEWFGESRPISSNDFEEGRRRNRRVEIMITPK
jgi:flagellar motor protein MotB